MKTNKNILSVKNKSILIIGGNGLLGTEFSKHLFKCDAKICVADTNEKEFNLRFKNYTNRKNLFFYKVDILKRKTLENCLKEIIKNYKVLDVVINCAAQDSKFEKKFDLSQFSSLFDYPINYWDKSINVNLKGSFIIAQVFSKYFAKKKIGHLINIGSQYGIVAPDQRIYKIGNKQEFYKPADYIVSKAGLIGLNKYLASYFRNTKIRFNILTPCGIENNQKNIFKKNFGTKTTLNRMSKIDEYNGAIQFLCSNASSYMTGSNLIIDGGWTAI